MSFQWNQTKVWLTLLTRLRIHATAVRYYNQPYFEHSDFAGPLKTQRPNLKHFVSVEVLKVESIFCRISRQLLPAVHRFRLWYVLYRFMYGHVRTWFGSPSPSVTLMLYCSQGPMIWWWIFITNIYLIAVTQCRKLFHLYLLCNQTNRNWISRTTNQISMVQYLFDQNNQWNKYLLLMLQNNAKV